MKVERIKVKMGERSDTMVNTASGDFPGWQRNDPNVPSQTP